MTTRAAQPVPRLTRRDARRRRSTDAFTPSRYNFAVPMSDCTLLYNAATGAVVGISGRDTPDAVAILLGAAPISRSQLPGSLFEQLLAHGFLLPKDTDEVALVRERYWEARRETPMVLTITVTMDCNLGCYYCYEGRTDDALRTSDVTRVVDVARQRLTASGKRSLHVDWYGGEPMLNIEFVETASRALQALCEATGVAYSASIISNGTEWPDDPGSFVRRHKIRQVQISFDGLRKNHDRRRRYRRGRGAVEGLSSFDRAVTLVDRLLDDVRVDIRLNLDRRNAGDVEPFIEFARRRGWFMRAHPAVLQPARLAAFSERSAFMRGTELSIAEFDVLRGRVRALASGATVEESEAPEGVPVPRTSVCAALAHDSVVVGADGALYRCGLQVSEPHRAVGELRASSARSLPILSSDARWWDEFDPTTLPSCSRCSFLPICWSGCPKKHLEGDLHAIAEQGAYWRTNLPRLIAASVGGSVIDDFAFSTSDQFRDSVESASCGGGCQ